MTLAENTHEAINLPIVHCRKFHLQLNCNLFTELAKRVQSFHLIGTFVTHIFRFQLKDTWKIIYFLKIHPWAL